jgi:hypothetical protein
MSFRMLFRGCFVTCLLAAPAVASAQVTITSPAAGQRLPVGPDYATDVLADPMDMNNVEDISQEPLERAGWASLNFSGGRLTGTTAPIAGGVADTTLAFLYRGFYGLVNPGRNGMRFPIDPNWYRKLSFKMSSGAVGENVQVYWFHRPLGDPAGVGMGMRYAGGTTGGDQIFTLDLAATVSGEPWNSALVRGFRIDPNSSQTGQQISFDWVRLTSADGTAGAAMHTITWTGGSGTTTIEVVDAAGTVMTVATGVTATSFAWNYGVLPPGAYTLRVRRGTAAVVTRAFSINALPVFSITDPDASGGADFASEVLHNPWDMAGAPDIAQVLRATGSYSNFNFHGTSDASGDPVLYLLNQTNNSTPIDGKRYRYLTFDLTVDGAYDLARGSVARVFWNSNTVDAGGTTTTTRDLIVFPGVNHYSIDLASLSATATGGLEPTGAAQNWTAAPIRFLRLDPHELPEVRAFHLGPVKLAAMDAAAPSFTIRWAGADPDGDAVSMAFYYDTNTNPADGMTAITSGVSMSAGAYVWNAAAVPVGAYYIYAVANDGIQSYSGYSSAPVSVSGGTSPTNVAISIDTPANNATVSGAFTVAGWAIDRGAATGSGVDAVHVYAYPNPGSGQAPVFLGSAGYGGARGDVANAYGSQFTNSGYGLSGSLAAGTYQVVAHAHSTVTGAFSGSTSVMLNVVGATSAPRMAFDAPANGSVVTQPFAIGGWAIDLGAPSGTGIDAIHIYAYPNPGSGAAPVFVGVAGYGGARGDIASAYGARFQNSGFGLGVSNLAPGLYQLVAFAHSTVTGTFNNSASAVVRISAPVMSLDTPKNNAIVARGFAVAGWAIDLGAPSGTGVDAVHVYAFPTNGAPAIFVGVASYGYARADVGGAYGSRFTNSGFNIAAGNVPAGVYDLVAYAHSGATGTFNNWRVARVTVQ